MDEFDEKKIEALFDRPKQHVARVEANFKDGTLPLWQAETTCLEILRYSFAGAVDYFSTKRFIREAAAQRHAERFGEQCTM